MHNPNTPSLHPPTNIPWPIFASQTNLWEVKKNHFCEKKNWRRWFFERKKKAVAGSQFQMYLFCKLLTLSYSWGSRKPGSGYFSKIGGSLPSFYLLKYDLDLRFSPLNMLPLWPNCEKDTWNANWREKKKIWRRRRRIFWL